MMEFHTVKRIDNSRLVRHVEPAKMRESVQDGGAGRRSSRRSSCFTSTSTFAALI